MPGTTTAALCPVDVMNRAYGSRTAPGTIAPETIRKRHQHGQVFTPYHLSKEAAATLDLRASATGTIHILDAGAGDGQLTLATLARIGREPEATRPRQIYLTAVEADAELADAYEKNLTDIEARCKERHMDVRAAVVPEDFLSPRRWRCRSVNVNAHMPINTCIMNPPYRRTRNADPETQTIRLAGAATSANLYSAFCEIGWRNLQAGGKVTAITPRSFRNGSTFAEFRRRLETDVDIDCIHIWQNRRTLYGVQNVVQETVCWHGTVTKRTPMTSTHGHHPRKPRAANDVAMENPGRSEVDPITRRPRTAETHDEQRPNRRNAERLGSANGDDRERGLPRRNRPTHRVPTPRDNERSERRRPDTVPQRPAHLTEQGAVAANGKQELLRRRGRPAASKAAQRGRVRARQPIAPNELEPRAQACAISSETTNNQPFVASDRVNVISL